MSRSKGFIRGRRLSLPQLGLAFVVVSLVIGTLLFQKNKIGSMLTPGEYMTVQLENTANLREFISEAKVAGVPVGKVTAIERIRGDLSEVTVKVGSDIPGKLGSLPSAELRPTTLLGGNYYVDLVPGGVPGALADGTIPVERTSDETELDQVVGALQPDARDGIQSSVRDLDATLENGGSGALQDLARNAPGTLLPAAEVLSGLQGTNPQTDLTALVSGLESTSRVLSEQQGQLDGIVTDLRVTSNVLDRRSGDLAATLHDLPATLRSTDVGLERLDVTLGKLRDTAGPARPIAAELDTLLERLDPVLVEARPVVNNLREVVTEARPLVSDLVPASQQLTSVLDDVRGPVLERVNGPILDTVNSPYQGSGPYAATRGDRPFYQELSYMVSNMDRVAEQTDQNGAMVAFLAGVGPGSVAGLPISLEQLFNQLAGYQEGGR